MTLNCDVAKQRGWWRITNPDTVKELLSCLTVRGIRERSFQKNLERYLNYACQLCTKSKKSGTYRQIFYLYSLISKADIHCDSLAVAYMKQ